MHSFSQVIVIGAASAFLRSCCQHFVLSRPITSSLNFLLLKNLSQYYPQQFLHKSRLNISTKLERREYIMCEWCRQNGLVLCLLYVDFPKCTVQCHFSRLHLKIMIKIYLTKLWSSGKGQARIGKGWQSRWKASKLKPLPRAYTKVGCHHPPPPTHPKFNLA